MESYGPGAWLLNLSLTRWNYVLSIAADAAVALGMLVWSLAATTRPLLLLPVGTCALLGYTLTEYSWHRFLFHTQKVLPSLRKGHARHHGSPRAPLALPFVIAVPHALVVWGLATMVVGSSLGAFFTAVWFSGYVAYAWLHHLMHAERQWSIILWLRENHEVHHRRQKRNFGVTSPLWDVVFGTYAAPSRDRRRLGTGDVS